MMGVRFSRAIAVFTADVFTSSATASREVDEEHLAQDAIATHAGSEWDHVVHSHQRRPWCYRGVLLDLIAKLFPAPRYQVQECLRAGSSPVDHEQHPQQAAQSDDRHPGWQETGQVISSPAYRVRFGMFWSSFAGKVHDPYRSPARSPKASFLGTFSMALRSRCRIARSICGLSMPAASRRMIDAAKASI